MVCWSVVVVVLRSVVVVVAPVPMELEPLALEPLPMVPAPELVVPAPEPIVLEPVVPEPIVLEPAALPESEDGVPVVPIGVFCVLCCPAPWAGLAALGDGGVLWAMATPIEAAAAPAIRDLRRVEAFIDCSLTEWSLSGADGFVGWVQD